MAQTPTSYAWSRDVVEHASRDNVSTVHPDGAIRQPLRALFAGRSPVKCARLAPAGCPCGRSRSLRIREVRRGRARARHVTADRPRLSAASEPFSRAEGCCYSAMISAASQTASPMGVTSCPVPPPNRPVIIVTRPAAARLRRYCAASSTGKPNPSATASGVVVE